MFLTEIVLVLRLGGKRSLFTLAKPEENEMFSKINPINPREFSTYTRTQ